MWLFFSGTVIIYLGKGKKHVWGNTRRADCQQAPNLISFPNLKKNLYTEKKYKNNEETHISDANRCDQNGEEKTNYESEIPIGYLKTLKMGSLSQVSGHQLKCIKKNACQGNPKKLQPLYFAGAGGPLRVPRHTSMNPNQDKKHWNLATRHRQTKHNKTFAYYKPGSHRNLTLQTYRLYRLIIFYTLTIS